MSFLRIATLFAAIMSLVVFVLSLTTLILDFSRDPDFLFSVGTVRMVGIFTWPIFYIALTVFFIAQFLRQEE
jgi:uncharacterized BrkB/YihY/UPF0761 family membrane protein